MRASRPIYRLPDDGLGARIAGEVRPVNLDVIGGMEFIWYDRRCPGRAYSIAWPEMACPEWVIGEHLLPLLLNYEEEWSPPLVLDAAVRGFRKMLGLPEDDEMADDDAEDDPCNLL